MAVWIFATEGENAGEAIGQWRRAIFRLGWGIEALLLFFVGFVLREAGVLGDVNNERRGARQNFKENFDAE